MSTSASVARVGGWTTALVPSGAALTTAATALPNLMTDVVYRCAPVSVTVGGAIPIGPSFGETASMRANGASTDLVLPSELPNRPSCCVVTTMSSAEAEPGAVTATSSLSDM